MDLGEADKQVGQEQHTQVGRVVHTKKKMWGGRSTGEGGCDQKTTRTKLRDPGQKFNERSLFSRVQLFFVFFLVCCFC